MDIQFSALPSMTTSFQAVGGIAKWRLAMKTWFVPGQSWHQTMKLQNLLCQGPPLRAEPQRRPSFLETKIGQNQKNKHTYWSHEYAKASPDRKYNDAIFSKLQVLFQLYHRNPKCQKFVAIQYLKPCNTSNWNPKFWRNEHTPIVEECTDKCIKTMWSDWLELWKGSF